MKTIRRPKYKRFRVTLRGYHYVDYVVRGESEDKALMQAAHIFGDDPDSPVKAKNIDSDWYKIEEIPDDYE